MRTRSLPAALAAMLAAALPAQAAPPLLFVAPANHAAPFVELRGETLTGGILKELGDAIAARVGREARYVVMPAKRVGEALERGTADVLCYSSPQWIKVTKVRWSRPVFDYAGVVARRQDAPAVSSLSELAGEPIGTVVAYRYAEVEAALGARFVRDDAPDMSRNLAKLAAGRTRYAMTEQLTLAYARRSAPLQLALETTRYPTYCAFSLQRQLPLDELDRAIEGLVKDGEVERILSHYR